MDYKSDKVRTIVALISVSVVAVLLTILIMSSTYVRKSYNAAQTATASVPTSTPNVLMPTISSDGEYVFDEESLCAFTDVVKQNISIPYRYENGTCQVWFYGAWMTLPEYTNDQKYVVVLASATGEIEDYTYSVHCVDFYMTGTENFPTAIMDNYRPFINMYTIIFAEYEGHPYVSDYSDMEQVFYDHILIYEAPNCDNLPQFISNDYQN